MISRIYIVGRIKDAYSISTQMRFSAAQKQLEKLNLITFNPLNGFLLFPTSKGKAIKHNLKNLMDCNAVYILNDLDRDSINQIEISLALKLDLLIIHEF